MLTDSQIQRYSRHLILKEVGGKGQKKINDAKVFLVGAGGLGSPSALYLAAAGVGTLGIIDADTVDLSNLQRQILHSTDRVGVAKVESARQTLSALNPDITINVYQDRISSANIMDLIR
ncbi:MAG TPA: ThiF family adenylyltransferase, partial [Nitrospiria bacterium]|nr:ThiF family adenylyltransferase [Nitrospiria bacterium]